jgi:hypothetical protein
MAGVSCSGRSGYTSPFIEGGWGDGELHLFGDKNPLHPTLLHQGGGEYVRPGTSLFSFSFNEIALG